MQANQNQIFDEDESQSINFITYELRILTISLKIKFPCKMYLTFQNQTITRQIDLSTQNIDRTSNGKNLFEFNQLVKIRPASSNANIILNIQLKTAKGSVYQAGIIQLKQQTLIINEGLKIKGVLQKCLDNQSTFQIKVQKVIIPKKNKKLSQIIMPKTKPINQMSKIKGFDLENKSSNMGINSNYIQKQAESTNNSKQEAQKKKVRNHKSHNQDSQIVSLQQIEPNKKQALSTIFFKNVKNVQSDESNEQNSNEYSFGSNKSHQHNIQKKYSSSSNKINEEDVDTDKDYRMRCSQDQHHQVNVLPESQNQKKFLKKNSLFSGTNQLEKVKKIYRQNTQKLSTLCINSQSSFQNQLQKSSSARSLRKSVIIRERQRCINCKNIQYENAQQKITIQSLQKKLQLSENSKTQLTYLKQQNNLMESTINQLQDKMKNLVEINLELQSQIQDKNMSILQLKNEVSDQCDKLQQSQEDSVYLKSCLSSKQKDFQEIEKRLQTYQNEIRQLRNLISQKQNFLQDIEIQLTIKSTKNFQLQKDNEKLKNQNFQLTQQIQQVSIQKDNFQRQLKTLSIKTKKVSQELQEINKKYYSTLVQDTQSSVLEKTVNVLKKNNEMLQNQLNNQSNQFQVLKKRHKQLNAKFRQSEKNNETLHQQIELKNDQLQKLKKEYQQIQDNLNQLQHQRQLEKNKIVPNINNNTTPKKFLVDSFKTLNRMSSSEKSQEYSSTSIDLNKEVYSPLEKNDKINKDNDNKSIIGLSLNQNLRRQNEKLLQQVISLKKQLLLSKQMKNKQIFQEQEKLATTPKRFFSKSQVGKTTSSQSQSEQLKLSDNQNNRKMRQMQKQFKLLLRQKDDQIEEIQKIIEQHKMAIFKLQKQDRLKSQTVFFLQEEQKRLSKQLQQQRNRYKILLQEHHQISMQNSHLKYQLTQKSQQILLNLKQNQQKQKIYEENIEIIQEKTRKQKQKLQRQKKQLNKSLSQKQLQNQSNKSQIQKKSKQIKFLKQKNQKISLQKQDVKLQTVKAKEQIHQKQQEIIKLNTIIQSLKSTECSLKSDLQTTQKKLEIIQKSLQSCNYQKKEAKLINQELELKCEGLINKIKSFQEDFLKLKMIKEKRFKQEQAFKHILTQTLLKLFQQTQRQLNINMSQSVSDQPSFKSINANYSFNVNYHKKNNQSLQEESLQEQSGELSSILQNRSSKDLQVNLNLSKKSISPQKTFQNIKIVSKQIQEQAQRQNYLKAPEKSKFINSSKILSSSQIFEEGSFMILSHSNILDSQLVLSNSKIHSNQIMEIIQSRFKHILDAIKQNKEKLKIYQSNSVQHTKKIQHLQNQLEYQQNQFAQWMRKMEVNLDESGHKHLNDHYSYQVQIKKLNSLLESRQTQENQKTKKLKYQQNVIEQLQQKLEDISKKFKQKCSEMNEYHYAFCLKEQKLTQQKVQLIEKINTANNHLLQMEYSASRLDEDFLRMKSEYESMLDYSYQEKKHLIQKIQELQVFYSQERHRRKQAERNLQYNRIQELTLQNQRLKQQISRIKRQKNMKQISMSIILKEKEEQLMRTSSMLDSIQARFGLKQSKQHERQLKGFKHADSFEDDQQELLKNAAKNIKKYKQKQQNEINLKQKDKKLLTINNFLKLDQIESSHQLTQFQQEKIQSQSKKSSSMEMEIQTKNKKKYINPPPAMKYCDRQLNVFDDHQCELNNLKQYIIKHQVSSEEEICLTDQVHNVTIAPPKMCKNFKHELKMAQSINQTEFQQCQSLPLTPCSPINQQLPRIFPYSMKSFEQLQKNSKIYQSQIQQADQDEKGLNIKQLNDLFQN